MNSSLQMEIRITEMLMLNEIRKLKACQTAVNEIVSMYEEKLEMLRRMERLERRAKVDD